MRDNIHATFLAHGCIFSKMKDVEAFRKIFKVEVSTIKLGRHTWYKLNVCIFALNIYSMICTCFMQMRLTCFEVLRTD